jgi:Flp pilus assembly protein TadB
MHSKARNYSLVFCLFVFLFVIIGGGLHLNPGGAFLAAATGTPLVIYAFHRKANRASRQEDAPHDAARNEVAYVSSKPDKFD